MGRLSFQASHHLRNDLLLPAAMYGIRVPAGLSSTSVPAPNFIDPTTMVSLLRSARGGHGGGLGVTHGLTTTDFAVTFSNSVQQWRQRRTSAAVPSWQFQGGDVFFDTTITVSVLDGDRPQSNDDLSRRLFAIIMEHEPLHVLDEIDIVSRWMAPQAYGALQRQIDDIRIQMTNRPSP